MQKSGNNYAFIDSQNLNLGIHTQGWDLSFIKFRKYLKEKYAITKAFVFLGYIRENESLYKSLRDAGFLCVFKPTIKQKGIVKGNCDAELVLQAMIEYDNYDKAIIVSGDGDFQCLARYLQSTKKLLALLIPNRHQFSSLLRYKIFRKYLRCMDELKSILASDKEIDPKEKAS